MSRATAFSVRAYRALLRLHPRDFRRRYGEAMAEHFEDLHRDTRRAEGVAGVARLWRHALVDLLSVALRERLDTLVRHLAGRAPVPQPSSDPRSPVLRTLAYDLRFSLRMLRQSPVLALTAVLVIALGTGAVSTVFSIANAVILRPLPAVERPGEIVEIERSRAHGGTLSASYPFYQSVAGRTRLLQGMAAWTMQDVTASTGGQGIATLGNAVTGNYFALLGARPALGRFFVPEETRDVAGDAVVVVSHGFWTRQLGADSAAIGRPIVLNGTSFTVVGVAAPRFAGVFPLLKTEVWVPLAHQRTLNPGAPRLDEPGAGWLQMFGRLADGASRDDARRELSALAAQYAASDPDRKEFGAARVSRAMGLPADVALAVLGFFGVLLAVAGMVLVIASVNVAGMLLARSIARRREIVVRLALGASRGRLVRQLLTENLLLFALGGLGGAALAIAGTGMLTRIDLPVDVPLNLDASPDLRAFVVTMGLSLVVGVLVGLAPALRASRPDLTQGLRDGTTGAGRRRSRLRDALLVAQVAFSLVLLAVSGLFVRALEKGRGVHPGFEVDGVATTAIDVSKSGYDEARQRAFYARLAQGLLARPGVTSVGFARVLPLSMNTMGLDVAVDGYAPPGREPGAEHFTDADMVDGGYFPTIRHALVAGRTFQASDDSASTPVAIVNESFARRYWPDGTALGRTFRSGGRVHTIVGIARDAKFSSLDQVPEPFAYFALAQRWSTSTNLLVRTSGDAARLAQTIREEMRALDPSLPTPTVTTFRQAASVVLLPQRVAVAVTGALGLVGVLLAVVGLYGVLSFSAAQRVRELGVRLALGATRGNVLRLVVGEGLRLAGIGMAVGLALALLATQALKPFLLGVSPLDPATFGGIVVGLGAAAAVASWLPARRAANVDPVVSLRQE